MAAGNYLLMQNAMLSSDTDTDATRASAQTDKRVKKVIHIIAYKNRSCILLNTNKVPIIRRIERRMRVHS